LTKTTLDTFKVIEELLVDDPSKEVVEDGGQIKVVKISVGLSNCPLKF